MRAALALSGLLTSAFGRDWALHKLDQQRFPRARCLDGSPGAIYVQPGAGAGANTFLIHLQGGGWCWGLENCAQRAFGGPVYADQPSLGSSTEWGPGPCVPGTLQTNNTPPCVADGSNGGILSSNATLNPHFADATKVWLGYCSGDSFAGLVDAPVAVNATTSLYFRGRAILDAAFETLVSDFGLRAADAVLFAGCSAGGEGVFFLADEVGAMVHAAAPRARFAGMPGAGFLGFGFPAMNGTDIFSPELQWVYENMGLNVSGSAACRAARAPSGDAWLFFRADVALGYATTPLFISNSITDATQLGLVLDLGCSPQAGSCSAAQLAYLDAFSAAMIGNLSAALHAPSSRHGGFLVACVVHVLEGLDGAWARIPVQGVTQAQAFANWWTGAAAGPHAVIDALWTQGAGKPYGGNPACGEYLSQHMPVAG